MKTNFKRKSIPIHTVENNESHENEKPSKLTKLEFEAFLEKTGYKGSFMIYRSKNKNEELGLDEL